MEGRTGNLTEAQIVAKTTRHDLLMPGTPAFAYQTLDRIRLLWGFKSTHSESWAKALEEMLGPPPIWEIIPEDVPYRTPQTMCQKELGIAYDQFKETVRVLVGDDAWYRTIYDEGDAPTPGGDRKSAAYRENQSDNITLISDRGTSATYGLRRLRRDRPDLAQRILDGDLSVNAAMVEAGFRDRQATFYPENLEKSARTFARHFDPEQWEQVYRMVRTLLAS